MEKGQSYTTSTEGELQVNRNDQGEILSVVGVDHTVEFPEFDDQDTELNLEAGEDK